MTISRVLLNCAAVLAAQFFACSYSWAALVVVPSPHGNYFGAAPHGGNSMDIDIDGNGVSDVRLVAGTSVGSSGSFSLAINAIGPSCTILGLPPLYADDLGSDAFPVPFGTRLSIQDPPFSTYGAQWFEDDVITIENPGGGFPGSGTIEFRAGSVLYGVADRGIIGEPPVVSGYWRPGERRALGIRFADSSGTFHYSWMDITVQSAFGLQIHGWAYEDASDLLVTPFIIPEISSHAIVLLFVTANLLRRRRPNGVCHRKKI